MARTRKKARAAERRVKVLRCTLPCALLAALAGGWFFLCPGALAEGGERPVLVEMFLSQSCKASPPAAEFVADLSERQDLVALVWHVGYWDMMEGRAGAWRDPFSQPAFVERHRLYNKRIRGKEWGMTPQAVVDGATTVPGAKRADVLRLVDAARDQNKDVTAIDFNEAGSRLGVTIEDGDGEAFLVRFVEKSQTKIEGGDNAGIVFSEANVVTGFERLGALSDSSASFSASTPGAGEGCAVIVQDPGQGRVRAARYCP